MQLEQKTTVQRFFIQSRRKTKVFMFSEDKNDRLLLTMYPAELKKSLT